MTLTATMALQYTPLGDAVADLRAVADELEQGRRSLHRTFGAFLGGGWTGRAAASFEPGWDEWSTGVANVLDALRSIADLLQAHAIQVAEVDAGSGGDVIRLHDRLGRVGAP